MSLRAGGIDERFSMWGSDEWSSSCEILLLNRRLKRTSALFRDPIHRLRELGFHDRVFDMLDEHLLTNLLTKTKVLDFCYVLFGKSNAH